MKPRGTTLIEMLITLSIMAMSFVILGGVFLTQGRYLAIMNATSDVQYQSFQALDTFGLFASSASAVVASRTINGRSYQSGTSTVILALPSINSSGAVIQGLSDYVAFGLYQSDRTKFMYDVDSATGSARLRGQFLKASLVEKLIFRYNATTPAAASAIDLYIRTMESARDRVLRMPLGKIYYLGSS
jgi:prepilin-type N-terminal cleavage/methylation domain-containing protein